MTRDGGATKLVLVDINEIKKLHPSGLHKKSIILTSNLNLKQHSTNYIFSIEFANIDIPVQRFLLYPAPHFLLVTMK